MLTLSVTLTSFLASNLTIRTSYSLQHSIGLFRSASVERNHFFFETISPTKNARLKCGSKHGEVNFLFGRCFFMQSFDGVGLNLTSQIDKCSQTEGATLSYPRTIDEISFIWNFYKNKRGSGEHKFTHARFDDFRILR